MTGSGRLPDTGDEVIGSYLTAIAARLPGPATSRRDILDELRAGVADAADTYRGTGLNPVEAARAAIDEFGSPDRVAAEFHSELAAAQARRTAVSLLAIGPLTGAVWIAAALASHIGRLAPPWEWALPAGARLAGHLAIIALVVAIGSTLFTLAATGRLTRWLDTGRARPAASAAIAAGSVAAVDVALLAALVMLAATPGRLAVLPLAAAGAASLVRLGFAARSARTCFTMGTARHEKRLPFQAGDHPLHLRLATWLLVANFSRAVSSSLCSRKLVPAALPDVIVGHLRRYSPRLTHGPGNDGKSAGRMRA